MRPPPTAATGLPRPPRIAAAKPLTPMPAPTSNAVCVSGATTSPASGAEGRGQRERRRHHARSRRRPRGGPRRGWIDVARIARPNVVLR